MHLWPHVVPRTLGRPQQGGDGGVGSAQRVRLAARPVVVRARHRAPAHVTAQAAGRRARAPRAAALIGRPLAAGAWLGGRAVGSDGGVVAEEAVRCGVGPHLYPSPHLPSAGRLLSDDDRAVLQVQGEAVQVRRVLAAGVYCSTAQQCTIQQTTRQCSTAQHCTIQQTTGQCSTAQHCAIQHTTGQCSTAQHCTIQHSTGQSSTAQHNTTDYRAMQYNTKKHSTAQYNRLHGIAVQYNTTQHHTWQWNTI